MNEIKPQSALVAMSGGVDSTVAAMLAMRNGFNCTGATMKVYAGSDKTVSDARNAASFINIPFHEFDFIKPFEENVIKPFIDEYRQGRTPNPCIICNKYLKFGIFMDKTTEMGMDRLITGHYVQVEYSENDKRYFLKKGLDPKKDQSYVLYSLTQEQLAKVVFPLGCHTKTQVREIANKAGYKITDYKESQDICFIPDGDYMKFINEYTGEVPEKGRFVDINGNDLGENKGVSSYTIGQRRGLGLAMPHPPYVIELCPENNTVVIGTQEMLYSKTLDANNINFIAVDKLDSSIKANVKIRYSDPGHLATIHQTGEDTLKIEFDEPQRAITKGQAAVIYDGEIVIGGGTIC